MACLTWQVNFKTRTFGTFGTFGTFHIWLESTSNPKKRKEKKRERKRNKTTLWCISFQRSSSFSSSCLLILFIQKHVRIWNRNSKKEKKNPATIGIHREQSRTIENNREPSRTIEKHREPSYRLKASFVRLHDAASDIFHLENIWRNHGRFYSVPRISITIIIIILWIHT